ncbi:MAG: PSP1 domain-containing protein [Phycisphaerales bacterium]
MSIHPLPVFEQDADPARRSVMTDEELYQSLEVPKSLVVKFGSMKLIAELPYDGSIKPGCGTRLVARTHRGTELVEMLTTTCENAGCSKSITRKEMLEYIDNSGGKDFPFTTQGRVLRVATIEDMNQNSELRSRMPEALRFVRAAVKEHGLDMKVVEVEPILGNEQLSIYYMSEQRIDFRNLVKHLAGHFQTRIEMRQVGARDEARLVADYERCGQHCCCKNFLKVLKPISMRAAKTQKATLDPLKISGRCGRLMCCLRYEDQTYRELKKNLPHRKTRVGTPYGVGTVLDSRILAQLVLVELDHNRDRIAVPVEELMDPDKAPPPGATLKAPEGESDDISSDSDPLRGMSEEEVAERAGEGKQSRSRKRGSKKQQRGPKGERQDTYRERAQAEGQADETTPDTESKGADEGGPSTASSPESSSSSSSPSRAKRRRGRRGGRKRRQPGSGEPSSSPQAGGEADPGKTGERPADKEAGDVPQRKKRRKRRRRGGGNGRSGEPGSGSQPSAD